MYKLLVYTLALMTFWSCAPAEGEENAAASAQEVKEMDEITNSSLINNPVSANEAIAPEDAAKIEFEEEVFDFGDIAEGDVVEHIFNFKNTGNNPLIISKATGSCGCTVPEWPRDPIAPGQTGELKVKFNSKGKEGEQDKRVTIQANTIPNNTVIRIVGAVAVDPDKQTEETEG